MFDIILAHSCAKGITNKRREYSIEKSYYYFHWIRNLLYQLFSRPAILGNTFLLEISKHQSIVHLCKILWLFQRHYKFLYLVDVDHVSSLFLSILLQGLVKCGDAQIVAELAHLILMSNSKSIPKNRKKECEARVWYSLVNWVDLSHWGYELIKPFQNNLLLLMPLSHFPMGLNPG